MKAIVCLVLLAAAVNCYESGELQLDFGPEGLKNYLLHRFPDGDIDFCDDKKSSDEDLLNFMHNLLVGNSTTVANVTLSANGNGHRTIKVNDLLHKKTATVTQDGTGNVKAALTARKGRGYELGGVRLRGSFNGKTAVAGKTYSGDGTIAARGGILVRHRCRGEDDPSVDVKEDELAFDEEEDEDQGRHHHRRRHRRGVYVVGGLGLLKTLNGTNFSRKVYVRTGARAFITKGRRGGVDVYVAGGSRRYIQTKVGNKTSKVAIHSRSVGSMRIRAARDEELNKVFESDEVVL